MKHADKIAEFESEGRKDLAGACRSASTAVEVISPPQQNTEDLNRSDYQRGVNDERARIVKIVDEVLHPYSAEAEEIKEAVEQGGEHE